MPVNITAIQDVDLETDIDSDGIADPGDTLLFKTTITNTGDTDATGVQFAQTLNGVSLVDGSINVSPIAFGDAYSAPGNVEVTVAAGSGLTVNDVEFFSDTFSVTAFDPVSGNGGTVSVNADGSFSYTSATGFTGTDSFTYTVTDSQGLTSTGTVEVEVGPSVWFIDAGAPAGGDGSQDAPFQTLAAFNAANAAGGASQPQTGDIIYLRAGTYTEADGINLKDGQTLVGQGQDLVVDGRTIEDGSAAQTPTIVVTGAGGEGVLLGQNNAVTGLDINVQNAGADGIEDGGGTVGTLLTISDVSITGAGQAVDIDQGGVLNILLDSVTSTGSSEEAIQLAGTSGSFTATTVALSGMTGDGVDLNGHAGSVSIGSGSITAGNTGSIALDIAGGANSVTIGANITDTNSNDVVEITGRTGGTVTLSGSVSASGGTSNGIDISGNTGGTVNFTGAVNLSTAANTAVSLSSNAGATVNFNTSGNGLDISTTSGTGFSATGGGTVTVTGAGNTISSGTGTALNVNGTTIGANDLTFQSIGSNGGSNTGIILDTTGSSGGLHVTGLDGGDAGSDPDAGSGGTIANKTGVDGATTTGNGIYLNNTFDVRLAGMQLNDFQNSAVRGLSVNGFSLEDSVISGAVGNNSGATEGAITFGTVTPAANGLVGNSRIDNVNISGSIEHQIEVYNQSGTMNLTISNSNIHDNTVASGADGIQMEFRGTAQGFVDINGNSFSNNKSQAIQISALEDSNIQATIRGNTVTRGTQGNDGIVLSNGGNADLRTLIDGNTISGFGGAAIFVGQVPGQGTAASLLEATIQNNTITSPADATNHAILAFLSSLSGQVSQARLLINNNNITYNSSAARAILVDAPDTGRTPEFHATVTNNLVTSTDPLALTMISVAARNGAIGHSDVRGNDVNYTFASPPTGINVREATGGSNVLASGASASNDSAVVLAANNPLSTTTVLPGSADIPVVANNTILLPVAPTLPSLPLLATPPGANADHASGQPALPEEPAAPALPTPAGVVDTDNSVSVAELALMVEAAAARWAAAGLTADQAAALAALTFSIEDMSGLYLAAFRPGHITLDSDAAGYGWFVDATPAGDTEFAVTGTSGLLAATADGGAAGRMDLLSTIMHEMGHALGLEDSYALSERGDLMYGYLSAGFRRIAEDGRADGAVIGAVASEAFIGAPISIGTLPSGQQVVIEWRATVDPQSGQFVVDPVNLGQVLGGNFPNANTNSTATDVDGLTLAGTLFNDTDGDGARDAGENGISGVTMRLYADDGDGVRDAGDTLLGSVATDGSGNYSFANLAAGDYIVAFDLPAGTPSVSPSGGDPDNNTDNDSNGTLDGGEVSSQAISLAYNAETVDDGTGQFDINASLDFGIFNAAPAINNLSGDVAAWTEGDPAVILDQGTAAAIVEDGASFNGGSLTVSVTANEVAAQDMLGISTAGTVSLSAGVTVGSVVSVGGVAVGTISSGGFAGDDLVVDFDSVNATAARLAVLFGAVTYFNIGGEIPTAGARTVTFTAEDSDGATGSASVTVQVTAVDDPSVAVNDAFSTNEATISTGSLFAANPLAADSDPEGDGFSVTAVNGAAVNVGTEIALASGALLTVNADGSFSYDPNGQFDALPDPVTSGASNTSDTDSFTYTITGGSTATVTIGINGLDSSDTLLGTAGTDNLFGGNFDDRLVGSLGADQMRGGTGTDTADYSGSPEGVVVNLGANTASGGFAEGDSFDSIENIIGSNLDDQLTGDAGSNRLTGLGGDDVYFVDSSGDVVIEAVTEGNDRVVASVTFRLTAGQEIETLETSDATGTTAINLRGNELQQRIEGNNGNNLLHDGGTGPLPDDGVPDTLVGHAGDDVYVVYDPEAVILEVDGEGLDRVAAGVNYVLGSDVSAEYFNTTSLHSTFAINLTGNGLVQWMRGNDGANVLDGGGGSDNIFGMEGADIFRFSTTLGVDNVDRLRDFDAVGDNDSIQLDAAIFTALALGTLAVSAFKDNALAPRDADDRIIYNSDTGGLFYDADGLGGLAAVKFARVDPGTPLSNVDFVVV